MGDWSLGSRPWRRDHDADARTSAGRCCRPGPDPQRPRRHPRCRGRRGYRQDDRARRAHRAAGGDRQRATIDQIVAVTFTEKAAGELKLRIRTELEKARRPDARLSHRVRLGTHRSSSRSTKPSSTWKRRTSPPSTASARTFCASGPSKPAWTPASRSSPSPAPTRLFDRAFREWFQHGLENPPEGVRRALRRLPPAWSPYADEEDGPVARLRKAAVDLREWRDLRAPVAPRPIRSRRARSRTCVAELCAFADLTAHPSWDKDPLFEATRPLRTLAADFRRIAEEGNAARPSDMAERVDAEWSVAGREPSARPQSSAPSGDERQRPTPAAERLEPSTRWRPLWSAW